MNNVSNNDLKKRQPIIAVMGHVDHGKTSLLDAIKSTNIADKEVGGITQNISGYEIEYISKENKTKNKITFIDTPGHESFINMRENVAKLIDIAILIVSSEDGVKEQTKESFKIISANKIPFIVAITKSDKVNANIQKVKNSLIENGIYIEGMGGDISCIETDAKTKRGLDELLDTILLLAELNDYTYNPNTEATGFVLDTILDSKRGISSTLIIKDGTMPKSGSVLADTTISPIRIIEDWNGKPIKDAIAGQIIRVTGFDAAAKINSNFITNSDKKLIEKERDNRILNAKKEVLNIKVFRNAKLVVPVILKTETFGSRESVEIELKKVEYDEKEISTGVKVKIVGGGIGNISENDVLATSHDKDVLIIGFNVKIENKAQLEADRLGIKINTFNIIYELSKWFRDTVEGRLPFEEIDKITGKLKILKTFSTDKDKQVLGARVLSGIVKNSSKVKIIRREFEIGYGKVTELQSMKLKANEVLEGNECGIMIESKTEIIPGDILDIVEIEKKKII